MNLEHTAFHQLNEAKANFDSIYSEPDPREYYRVLFGLDYVIPDLAKPILRALINTLRHLNHRPVKVLDIGCSYGINAALARHPLDLPRIARRYTSQGMQALDDEQVAQLDRRYFTSWPTLTDARIVGLDPSVPALTYALNTGLLDAATSTNLEAKPPTARDAGLLADLDLIFSTGCVGYVTETTFRRVLDLQAKGRTPWIANFVLRMFPYDQIAAELARFGLVTEKLKGVTFVQRRFHSNQEASSTLELLDRKGIDTRNKEAEGLLHAELFVSRPAHWVERLPLAELVSVTSGANRRYGRRFARGPKGDMDLVH